MYENEKIITLINGFKNECKELNQNKISEFVDTYKNNGTYVSFNDDEKHEFDFTINEMLLTKAKEFFHINKFDESIYCINMAIEISKKNKEKHKTDLDLIEMKINLFCIYLLKWNADRGFLKQILDTWDVQFNVKDNTRYNTTFGTYLIKCGEIQKAKKLFCDAMDNIEQNVRHKKYPLIDEKFGGYFAPCCDNLWIDIAKKMLDRLFLLYEKYKKQEVIDDYLFPYYRWHTYSLGIARAGRFIEAKDLVNHCLVNINKDKLKEEVLKSIKTIERIEKRKSNK